MGRDDKMGVQLDVSSGDGYAGRLEVIGGWSGRRGRSQEERARIAAERFMPGVRVADAARKHGTTRWQIYDWRKRLRDRRVMLPERFAALSSFAACKRRSNNPSLKRPDVPVAPERQSGSG